MTYRCPTCRREAKKEGNKLFPFCCERCAMADLGAWLAEDYRIPDQPDTSASTPDGSDDASRGPSGGERR